MDKKQLSPLEKISNKMTSWIGTPASLVVHTFAFLGIFSLKFLGVSINDILLILTTAVSLEAIYLAIFIQMTVNRNTKSLEDLEEDVDDIQEDIEDIQEEELEVEKEEAKTQQTLDNLEKDLQRLLKDIDSLKQQRQLKL